MRIVKKCILPGLLGFLIYSIGFLITQSGFNFFGLFTSISFAYLIRTVDDLVDYKQDVAQNKTLFNVKVLCIILMALLATFIALSIFSSQYFVLLSLIGLLLLLFKSGFLSYLRTLIAPIFLVLITFEEWKFNAWIIAFISLIFVGDIVLTILKGKKIVTN